FLTVSWLSSTSAVVASQPLLHSSASSWGDSRCRLQNELRHHQKCPKVVRCRGFDKVDQGVCKTLGWLVSLLPMLVCPCKSVLGLGPASRYSPVSPSPKGFRAPYHQGLQ
ncbi:hypothetical protein B0H14DRAFT_2918129, partial [Mycena olivaceomarginata]